jgi:hypothetical protein
MNSYRSDIGKPFPAHFRYETDMRPIGFISEILYYIIFSAVYLYLKLYLSNILLKHHYN